MRILHTSDWHLGRMLDNISRLEEQEEFIDCLCRIAQSEKVDLVLIAGDIYDTYNPSAAAEELFYEALDRLNGKGRRAVVVISGNHDNPERLCAASPLASKNGIILLGYPGSDAGANRVNSEYIKVIDSGPGWFEISISSCKHNAVIITLPYPSEARLDEVLTKDNDESRLQRAYSDRIGALLAELSKKYREDTVNLAVAHIFMRGGMESESERTLQVGGALTVAPEVLPSNAHCVALGHLHRPQKVKDAPCPAYYSGSPLAYSFSEADYSKAVYIIDAEPGKVSEVKEIYLDCGRPLRRWKAENGVEEAIRWCIEGRDKNAWIDLEIYTDCAITPEDQRTLRGLNPGIINIRPIIRGEDRDTYDYQMREGRKTDELFREYYRFKTGMEISDELMSMFIEVLNQQDEEEENKIGGEAIEAKVS